MVIATINDAWNETFKTNIKPKSHKKRNSVNETVLKKVRTVVNTHAANSNNDCTCFLCRCERPFSLIFAPKIRVRVLLQFFEGASRGSSLSTASHNYLYGSFVFSSCILIKTDIAGHCIASIVCFCMFSHITIPHRRKNMFIVANTGPKGMFVSVKRGLTDCFSFCLLFFVLY